MGGFNSEHVDLAKSASFIEHLGDDEPDDLTVGLRDPRLRSGCIQRRPDGRCLIGPPVLAVEAPTASMKARNLLHGTWWLIGQFLRRGTVIW
jgi:hypothetical protein